MCVGCILQRKKQEKKEKKTETETETATEMTDTVELDSRDDECQSDSDFEDEIEEPVSTEGFLESLKKGGHIDFSPFVCDIGMEDDMMFDFRSQIESVATFVNLILKVRQTVYLKHVQIKMFLFLLL